MPLGKRKKLKNNRKKILFSFQYWKEAKKLKLKVKEKNYNYFWKPSLMRFALRLMSFFFHLNISSVLVLFMKNQWNPRKLTAKRSYLIFLCRRFSIIFHCGMCMSASIYSSIYLIIIFNYVVQYSFVCFLEEFLLCNSRARCFLMRRALLLQPVEVETIYKKRNLYIRGYETQCVEN